MLPHPAPAFNPEGKPSTPISRLQRIVAASYYPIDPVPPTAFAHSNFR
jgi:hypothetical protein